MLKIPVWPKSDINKQDDEIGLTQTRSRVFPGLFTWGNDPEDDISIAGPTIREIVSRPHEKWAQPHGRAHSFGFLAK
jgi:hypothetical protein